MALSLGISIQLGILGLHKYFHFFRESTLHIANFFGLEAHIPLLQIALPVGVSFYCFQAIAYLVDIKRGHDTPTASLLDFAIFQAFFPKLLLGPICRSHDLLPQIQKPRTTIPNIHHALLLILSGLIKKMIIATMLYEYGVPQAFLDPEGLSALSLWIAAFGYTAQLYCDFSGYTDLALGFAMLLGFTLPPNFASPYVATNLGDFWKRWHMSFSRWLRDYIYIPLGGAWCSPNRISINLFLTFLFCGIWHGASMGYLIWGAVHGVGLAVHKRRRDNKRKKGVDPTRPSSYSVACLGWMYTISFITFSRIVFQTPDLEHAWSYYTRMFNPFATGLAISWEQVVLILLTFGINLWGPAIFQSLSKSMEKPQSTFSLVGYILLFVAAMFSLFSLMPSGIPPFLYARF